MNKKSWITILFRDGLYRGIERRTNMFPKKMRFVNKLHGKIFENGEKIVFDEENVAILRQIDRLHETENDIIVYGNEEPLPLISSPMSFLGFDISGDSCYLSPLKRIFFETEKSFVPKCLRAYEPKLNRNGLFSEIDIAKFFSGEVRNKFPPNILEEDGMFRIVYVYLVQK